MKINKQELLQMITEIRSMRSETDYIEIKKAKGGAPKCKDTLSSFSNKNNGGVIIFGIDENEDYKITGVYDVDDLQKQISNQCKEMEPNVRVDFIIQEIEKLYVVAAMIPECAREFKPCYIKSKGMGKGSYVRVGDADEPMTDYEIQNLIISRGGISREDVRAVESATIEDLNAQEVKRYIDSLKFLRPKHYKTFKSLDDAMLRTKILCNHNGRIVPTLSGLLIFGNYPQEFFPNLCVTFIILPTNEIGISGENGERFIDNKRIEGNIIDMMLETERLVISSMKRGMNFFGTIREDTSEYPEEAIREAVRNSLIHRDYSDLTLGKYVQVRMFPNRLEIFNPGSLYGTVTPDNLESDHSTRNSALVKILEDLNEIENRGSGIDTMLHSMHKARLEPPKFSIQREGIMVTFKNHHLLDKDSIEWLANNYSNLSLNENQRVALSYIKNNGNITNREYQQLNNVDTAVSSKELKHMLSLGVIRQIGLTKGASYILDDSYINDVLDISTDILVTNHENIIIEYLKHNSFITKTEIKNLIQVQSEKKVRTIIESLVYAEIITPHGKLKGRKYSLKERFDSEG